MTLAPRTTAVIVTAVALALAWPGAAPAATRLFIRNHVNSNDARDLAAWNGVLAAATTGGLVTIEVPAGPLTKTVASPGGLPSNQTLSVLESPSGSLWIGTADRGLARRTRDGRYRRVLTSFDGLPTDRVQVLYRAGDSVWVGTSGGVALFTENAASGQVSLRRSDTNASTAGGLVSDDIRAFARMGDTLWCGTGGGLSAFVDGAWLDRRSVFPSAVEALLAWGDTLWVGTSSGPRGYSGGTLAPVSPGHTGSTLDLEVAQGIVYSSTNGLGVFRRIAGVWFSSGPGLPAGRVEALGLAPDGTLWAGTELGFARYEPDSELWSVYRTEGPAINDLQKAAVFKGEGWFTTGNATAPGNSLGLVLRTDGSSWSALTSAGTGGALQPTSVFGILAARDGHLWFGHCCAPDPPAPRVERYDPAADLWVYPGPTNVIAFGEAPNGRVYGGSVEFGEGVYVFEAGSGAVIDLLTPLNTQGSASGSGLISNNLRAIAFDPSGVGWIATAENGLDRWAGMGTDVHSDDAWSHFAAGLPSLSTTSLAVLDGSTAYVGTQSGIALLVGGIMQTTRMNVINTAIAGASVRDLVHDSRRIVWAATAAGLARIDDATGQVERFTTNDGLVDDDVRGLAWDEARGTLWVATAHGISEVHPQAAGSAAFGSDAYVFPNPVVGASGPVRIGGLTGSVTGEVRDPAGRLVRNFRVDPVSNAAWDLRGASGAVAAPGIYLIVLRDGARIRIVRVAVTR